MANKGYSKVNEINNNNNQEETIDLFELAKVILKKIWIILICLIIGYAGGYVYSSRGYVARYQASAMIYVYTKTTSVTSLADIAMYTYDEDVPLMKVLAALRDKEEGKKASLNYKKASGAELQEYFGSFLPEFDRERVHTSDIKKLLQWYDILVEAGITDFEESMAPTEGDNIDDRN